MAEHTIGTRAEWEAARGALLEREKELTRMGDEVARQRRELPWVPVDKDYAFQTADGAAGPGRAVRRPVAAGGVPLHVRRQLHGRLPAGDARDARVW
jgi:Bacterial protein of unknown function (DUF899)